GTSPAELRNYIRLRRADRQGDQSLYRVYARQTSHGKLDESAGRAGILPRLLSRLRRGQGARDVILHAVKCERQDGIVVQRNERAAPAYADLVAQREVISARRTHRRRRSRGPGENIARHRPILQRG